MQAQLLTAMDRRGAGPGTGPIPALEACPGCGSRVVPSGVAPGLGLCRHCTHYVFRTPIGCAKYDAAYAGKYLAYAKTGLGRRINQCRWALVRRYMPRGGDVLDWGCGVGAFVGAAPSGYRVAGYDVNPHTGFDGFGGLYDEQWDAVTMWDVVEHMEDPRGFVSGLRARYLFVVTPDVSSGLQGGDLRAWRHFRPDEHQHMFSWVSLVRMLVDESYRILHISNEEGAIRNASRPSDLVTVVCERVAH